MSSTSSNLMTRSNLEKLDAKARFSVLGSTTEPSDIPNFETKHVVKNGSRTYVDYEECISEMSEWLDNLINAGESSHNDCHRRIDVRTDIRHYTYSKSPTLPSPSDMERDGAHCIRINLQGTVEPSTRYTDPEAQNESYQQLWNFICIFADATGAVTETQYSQSPRDDFSVYLFYNF